jgi:hypothetical protein
VRWGRLPEEIAMKADCLSLLVTGFATVILLVTTLALDRNLFKMEADYWHRFAIIGTRYGIGAFLIWTLIVLLS